MNREHDRDGEREDGVILIVTALFLVALLIVAAIVVDLASLRQDRRSDRSAADFAALAGAAGLDPLNGGSPANACSEAWAYLQQNLGLTTPANACASFSGACDNAMTPSAFVVGEYTITVVTPVADGSPLMAALNQSVDGNYDAGPCQRLGVKITRLRTFAFGQLAGASSGTTTVSSVARYVHGPGGPIPTLTTLNKTKCSGSAGGIDGASGNIHVYYAPAAGNVGDTPGIIFSDSDGSTCASNNPVMNSQGSGSIQVDPTPAGTPGIVGLYAATTLGGVNAAGVYHDATHVTPTPIAIPARVTREPVDAVFHCSNTSDGCNGATDLVNQLIAVFGSGTPSGFNVVTGAACSPSGNVTYSTNTFFNCATFQVKNATVNLLANGANAYVFAGSIDVPTGGTLNVSQTGSPTPNANCNAAVPDTTLFLRKGGSFSVSSGGTANLCNTFVFAQGNSGATAAGSLSIQGGSTLFWRPARSTTSGFGKLMFWSEGSAQSALQGGGSLDMDGVVFIPSSDLLASGNASIDARNIQIWTDSLSLNGQSTTLLLRPDLVNSLPAGAGVRLIR